jgi:16S rRNA (guanine(966)-N(2))-methyltransferase RsmD
MRMLRIISGKYKRRLIQEADITLTRSTTDKNRQMVFNILGQYFQGGIALDLFAGSGAMGIEAISRGVETVYFVDINQNPFRVIRENLQALGILAGKEGFVFQEDFQSFLKTRSTLVFDYIFLDPPYSMPVIEPIIEFIENHKMLSETGIIIVETDKFTDTVSKIGGIMKTREVVAGHTKFTFYRWEEKS